MYIAQCLDMIIEEASYCSAMQVIVMLGSATLLPGSVMVLMVNLAGFFKYELIDYSKTLGGDSVHEH